MPTLRFFGHSACEVVHEDTHVLIDPFLTGNPLNAVDPDTLNPTAILLTHAHNDHVGDAPAIARRTGANLIGMHEIAEFFGGQGLTTHGMSIGGGYRFPWGHVKLTPAWHSSTYEDENGFHTLGTPAGILLTLGDTVLYHAGDTALFSDMALLPEVDLALIPIGDNYTMGPDDAVKAVNLIQPKRVVPIHYNTFPVIAQDAEAWAKRVEEETGIPVVVVPPGGSLTY